MLNEHSSFFKFDQSALSVVAAGQSVLEQTRLNIFNLSEADAFIKNYGFNYSDVSDADKLWYFHRRALVLLTEKLKFKIEDIPEQIKNPEALKDLRLLLIWASSPEDKNLQKWSCAVLRGIHVFIHAESDLFLHYAEEIQKQILTPFENCVIQSDQLVLRSFQKEGPREVQLVGFETKPYKTSSSTVIKLLAKPSALASHIYDKVGVRFITPTMFDSFQVIRFLVEENLISFPHILPDQSSNNMYPVSEFIEVCDRLEKKHGPLYKMDSFKVDRLLKAQLKTKKLSLMQLFRKENPYSSIDFRYIKFIGRKFIRINPLNSSLQNVNTSSQKEFSFFYPFEVQIIDFEAFKKMQAGDSDHASYKNRQIEAARKRILQS